MISTLRAKRCEKSIKQHVRAHNPGKGKADGMWGHPIELLITHRGYGSTQPLPEYSDGGNYEQNRRVEMRLLEPGEEGYCSSFAPIYAPETGPKSRPRVPKQTNGQGASQPKPKRPRSQLPTGTHHGNCWLRQSPQIIPNHSQTSKAAVAVAVGADGSSIAVNRPSATSGGGPSTTRLPQDCKEPMPSSAPPVGVDQPPSVKAQWHQLRTASRAASRLAQPSRMAPSLRSSRHLRRPHGRSRRHACPQSSRPTRSLHPTPPLPRSLPRMAPRLAVLCCRQQYRTQVQRRARLPSWHRYVVLRHPLVRTASWHAGKPATLRHVLRMTWTPSLLPRRLRS